LLKTRGFNSTVEAGDAAASLSKNVWANLVDLGKFGWILSKFKWKFRQKWLYLGKIKNLHL